MTFTSLLNPRTVNHCLGFAAAWYLAFFTSQSGAFTAAPVLLVSLVTLFVPGEKATDQRDNRWAIALTLFGLYSALTVALNDGTNRDYETAAKYCLGGFIAWRLYRYTINFAWIRAGAAIGAIITIYLVISQYNGQYRFTAFGNVIKWGNLASYQTILLVCMATLERKPLHIVVLLLLASGCAYATLISGTRGAVLPWLAVVPVLILLNRHVISKRILAGALAVLVVAMAATSLMKPVQHRLNATVADISQIFNGNFSGSVGIRLSMWDLGIQAGLSSPLFGRSYQMQNMWSEYTPTFDGMEKSAKELKSWSTKLHNTYVDTLANKGFIGLGLLVLMTISAFYKRTLLQKTLLLSPVLGVAAAGMADSTFDIGPTAEYFIIASSFLMLAAFELPQHRSNTD